MAIWNVYRLVGAKGSAERHAIRVWSGEARTGVSACLLAAQAGKGSAGAKVAHRADIDPYLADRRTIDAT